MEEKIDLYLDESVMYLTNSLSFQKTKEIEIGDFYLLKITDVCYDEQAPKKEALENVLSSLKMDGIHFLFLILGNKEKVDFYYGVSRDISYKKELDFAIKDIGDSILMPAIQGNFRGSRVQSLTNTEKKDIFETITNMSEAGVIEGVPGANKDDEKYQGIDRLINVMYGDVYCFMVVAKPLNYEAVLEIQENLYQLYDSISPYSKYSIQTGRGTNKGTSESKSTSSGTTDGSNGSTTVTKGTSTGDTETSGTNFSKTSGNSKSTGKSSNGNNSSNSTSESGSESTTEGESTSNSHQTGTSSSTAESIGTSTSKSNSTGETHGSSSGVSESSTRTEEYVSRKVQDFIKFMDDIVFPRLDYGKGKGTFLTSMCVMTKEPAALQKIKNTVTALYSGESGNKVPLKAFPISDSAKKAFCSFQLPAGRFLEGEGGEKYLTHFAMHHLLRKGENTCLGNWITTNELGMIAGLPQKEVVGLSLNEEVEFGLNYEKPKEKEDWIELGNLIQNGNELKNSPIYLDKKVLDQHIFVSGVTGSGKTTTCQKILQAADFPFLVIEPAKTEYRVMINHTPDIMIFTLGDNQTTPVKMNPLMFYPKESITSRVDMICACIESAFDMEAAIPQIIEQALYKSYEKKGWNIRSDKNTKYKDPFDGTGKAFPTISDLVVCCEEVVREQGFDDRLKNDYIGSIKARLLGLTNGGKGFLLDTNASIDFMDLLNHKVVFELENIRSSAEKSLIMGFILINLSEAIREAYQERGRIQHITLVEEAHRLLSKYVPGDNPNKKHSVEMFSDMLAEIRKYGESLVIVDQIPNKLTPDVLKNTNTKIIHRIFAADDKEAVGNTVMLKEEQKEFLSNLPSGRAVYFTTGTEKAVQIQIKRTTNTSEQTPDNKEIQKTAVEYYRENYKMGLFRGLDVLQEKPTLEQFACIKELNSGLVDQWSLEYAEQNWSISEETQRKMESIIQIIGAEALAKYAKQFSVNDGVYNYILNEYIQEKR